MSDGRVISAASAQNQVPVLAMTTDAPVPHQGASPRDRCQKLAQEPTDYASLGRKCRHTFSAWTLMDSGHHSALGCPLQWTGKIILHGRPRMFARIVDNSYHGSWHDPTLLSLFLA